nr:Uncharacterised protein [Klebsiella pneumoniae]
MQLPADRRRLRQPDLYRPAVIDITDRGPVVREIFNGLSLKSCSASLRWR